jgi:hypothetical protein
MIYNINISNGSRYEVIQYILQKKAQGKFKVIDIGGIYSGWSSPYIDAIIDINCNLFDNSNCKNIKFFNFDITNPNNYIEINEYILQNGKFDFAICTHVLEDIMNPGFVCEQIAKIANEGYIAFPSKFRELCRFEGQYRGYIHHRWIFDINITKNEVIAYPKINYIENYIFDRIANISDNIQDLSFFWKNNIEMKYLNSNFLGPNVEAVIGYYNNLFNLNN